MSTAMLKIEPWPDNFFPGKGGSAEPMKSPFWNTLICKIKSDPRRRAARATTAATQSLVAAVMLGIKMPVLYAAGPANLFGFL